MPVESIQCPKCGSPLQVESGLRQLWCTYCGSQLRITRGSSGHPLAVLDHIRADTSLLAKQRALEHLRQRRVELLAEREKLGTWWGEQKRFIDRVPSEHQVGRKATQAVVFSMIAVLGACMFLGSVVAGVTGDSSSILLSVMGFLLAGVMSVCVRSVVRERGRLVKKVEEERERARAALAQCEARLRAIDVELDQVWLRIDGLEKEITRLSMQV